MLYCAPVTKSRRRRTQRKPAQSKENQKTRAPIVWIVAVIGAVLVISALLIMRQYQGTSSQEPTFDSGHAQLLLEDLCKRGQRYHGAPKRQQSIDFIRSLIDNHVQQSAVQSFDARDEHTGVTHRLTNIIGRQYPERRRRLILGTHWDTELRADSDQDAERRDEPLIGANDGTSGLAVLLEVARVLNLYKTREVGIDFVFFDGDELETSGSLEGHQGSRYFARMLRSLYPENRPEQAIIIDMVGDCDQRFLPEETSLERAPRLLAGVWEAAEQLGYTQYFSKNGSWRIAGDHLPLQKVGIQAALLIDNDYAHWHTHEDRADRICAESLERVGKVLLRYVKNLEEESPNG